MIISRCPLRISFFGGGTDFPSFFNLYKGQTLSCSINKYVYVTLNKSFSGKNKVNYSILEETDNVSDIKHDIVREALSLFDLSGFEISSISDVPGNGSGLGSSSAFCNALVSCIHQYLGIEHNQHTIARFSSYIERKLCKKPIGLQDHYSTALGGLRVFHYGESVKNTLLDPRDEFLPALKDHLLLLYTGVSRDSSSILEEQVAHPQIDSLIQACDLVDHAVKFVYARNVTAFSELLNSGWEIKKKFAPKVTNDSLDKIYNKAMDKGAYGGKLLGAGGGGFFLFSAKPYLHQDIIEATGLRSIPFDFVFPDGGVEVAFKSH